MVRLAALLLAAAAAVRAAPSPTITAQSTSAAVQASGTAANTVLPSQLPNGPRQDDCPWEGVNPNGPPPDTGVTRSYHFEVARETVAPDGVPVSGLTINHQFPGPLIEANWGDIISVTVHNRIVTDREEGFTLHWHGMKQTKTPWYDGVPGVSQCPIAPGKTFTYTFQADQFGTSWYHSHYSSQYEDGAYGPMVIHGPVQPDVHYDYDLGAVTVADWYHESYETIVQGSEMTHPTFPPLANVLLNGVGCQLTTGACQWNATHLPRYHFWPGRTYRLRFVNMGNSATQKISIDNHKMTVIANDYVPVHPYDTDTVTVGIGQRTDVVVTATGQWTDAVYMRSVADVACSNETYINSEARALVLYPRAPRNAVPTSTATPWSSNDCRNDPLSLTVPYWADTPPAAPATVKEVVIALTVNSTGFPIFTMNNQTFRADYNAPTLALAAEGNLTYTQDPEWNVYNFGNNASVRMIFINNYTQSHPMHLHGHNYWVLAEGYGVWDGSIVNPSNPQRRDTQMMPPAGPNGPWYTVFEWRQENPGVWPFHCHVPIHVGYGLYLNDMELPDRIETDREIPDVIWQTCRDWDAYTKNHKPDQLGSGE